MTALSDDERAALRLADEQAQRRLDLLKAAELRGDAPMPFGAALGGVVSRPEMAAGQPPPTQTFEPLPTRPWWCGNPDCRMPGDWRPYPYCDLCAEADRRRRMGAHIAKAVSDGDRAALARLHRQSLEMGHAAEAAQVLGALFDLVRAGLPPVTDGATLAAKWLVALVGGRGLSAAFAYVKAPGWLTLEGPARAGKTNLAVAIFRALVDKAAAPAATDAEVRRALGMRFVPARLLRKAQQEHKLGAGEVPLIGEAARATVLVLDDLGNEGSDRGHAVGDVLFDRYEERLPTVVTTGLSREEVESRYGAGLMNRLFEAATVQLGGGGK